MGYKPEDIDKVIERFHETQAIQWKDPERFPKVLFGPFFMDELNEAFCVWEADNPDRLTSLALQYVPLQTIKFVPLFEVPRLLELYQKMKM